MDAIGHQHVGVQGAPRLPERFSQPMQVALAIFFREEAGLAIVATLHDVQGDVIEVDAGAAGHAGKLARHI